MHSFLHYLVQHPQLGPMLSKTWTMQALGLTPSEDWKIRKLYGKQLQEGQDYLNLKGHDNITRTFYTLQALLTLCDTLQTPHSQAFKQAIVHHLQPGGAMVPAQTQAVYATPQIPEYPDPHPQPFEPVGHAYPAPVSVPTEHPAIAQLSAQVAKQIQPSIAATVSRVMASHPSITPEQAVAWVLAAQNQTADHIREGQALIAEHLKQQPPKIPAPQPQPRKPSWLDTQDNWAMTLVSVCLIALTGIGAFFIVLAAKNTQPQPRSIPQSNLNSNWR